MNHSAEIKGEIKSLLWHVVAISFALFLVGLLASFVTGYFNIAVSISAGWIIALASFAILVLTISNAFIGETGGKLVAAFLGIFKLGIIGIALWWLISNKYVEPIPFLAGFSTIVLALIVEGIRIKSRCG